MGRGFRARRALLAVTLAGATCALGACSSSGSGDTSRTTRSRRVTSTTSLPPTSAPRLPRVTVVPATGLHDGQVVQVAVTGFPSGAPLAIDLCAAKGRETGAYDCDLDRSSLVSADAVGNAQAPLTVSAGPFGRNQTRCSATDQCLVVATVVSAGGSPPPNATSLVDFAP
jgi:hypothetical protein